MRRILIVSYYFPPSGGPGVQRVLKFVKYLREFGYEPTVLTVSEGAYAARDEELAMDIPEGVQVHRTRSIDPFSLYARLTGRSRSDAVMVGSVTREGGLVEKVASWVRANVFIPDARVGWVPFAVREGLRLHREEPIDVLFTSGPPHSTHLIGKSLKEKTGLPWVADFRDPWTDNNFYHELPMLPPARRIDQRLERSVLREADRITTVSSSWARLLAERGGRAAGEVAVVYNGFDVDDLAVLENEDTEVDAEAFSITHVGSLYASRNPTKLWATLGALRSVGHLAKLRIRLVGVVDESVRRVLVQYGLDSIATEIAYVPHEEAIRWMARAAMLLLVIEPFPNADGMITGKLYEYLASGRPVLALGERGGDADRLITESGGGRLLGRDDSEGMARMLQEHYVAWEEGRPRKGADRSVLEPYTRSAQTARLAQVFDAVCGSAQPERPGPR